jgi:hypothetical protein
MLTLSRPARRVLLLLIAFTVICAGPTPARAERPNSPLSILKQAPYQLEVTVLSIEAKDGPSRSKGVWHRVRVDRVLVAAAASEPIKTGDELAVVSTIYTLAPGTVGGTGDRGTFKGPNGLPIKGDRARLYANAAKDNSGTLTPVPPSGWQPVEPVIALIGADANAQAERTMPLLAALINANKLGTPALHLAAACDGRGGDGPAKPDAKGCLTNASRLRYAGDVVVLAVENLAPEHNTSLALDDALRAGRPLVALRSSINSFAPQAERARAAGVPFGVEVFGAAANAMHGKSTRILPPDADAAAHPILAGIRIPEQGLVLPSPALDVDPLPADCRVLLWGEPGDGKDIVGPRRPVLWVRERPRTLPARATDPGPLPAQRIAVTTLGTHADFENPEFRSLVLRMIAWAGGDDARPEPTAPQP